jgi:hypothetical protein
VRRQVEATPEQVVPVLEGWLSAVEVARVFGISRQSVARMMADGTFRTLRTVGERPLYIVREEEVNALLELREEYASWPKAALLLAKLPDRKVGANHR